MSSALRVVGCGVARRHLPDILGRTGSGDQLEGVLLALGLVVDHARDARVHLRAAELLLVDLAAHAGAATTGGPPANSWLVPFTITLKWRHAGVHRRQIPADRPSRPRRPGTRSSCRPRRADVAVRQVGAAELLEGAHAAAGGVQQADEGQTRHSRARRLARSRPADRRRRAEPPRKVKSPPVTTALRPSERGRSPLHRRLRLEVNDRRPS